MKRKQERAERHGRKYWTRLVDQFEKSSESQADFAKRVGVNVLTFRTWLYRVRGERRVVTKAGLRKRRPAKKKSAKKRTSKTPTLQFVELATAPHITEFEIVLTSGRVVRVPSSFEEGALRRLLAVVESA